MNIGAASIVKTKVKDRPRPKMVPLRVVLTDGNSFLTKSMYGTLKTAKIDSDGVSVIYLDSDPNTCAAWVGDSSNKIPVTGRSKKVMKLFGNIIED
jgi:hypothetical protein